VQRESGAWALRFRAYGRRQYVTLGAPEDGWTQAKAQTELHNVLADVRRGIWQPAEPEPAPEVNRDPTFHEFASQWFDASQGEWRPKTVRDYEWQLTSHLLPFFKNHRLSQITVAEVDRYRQAKVAQNKAIQAAAAKGKPQIEEYVDKRGRKHHRPRRVLSVTSINKTITRLGQILEVAAEYGLIAANPAKGRRRRLKTHKTAPVWLDRAEHIEALLNAAGELDQQAEIKGGQDHVRRRVLDNAIEKANEKLAKAGDVPLPDGLTPHKLRHTFASILVALGVDPGSVMDQLGHADPGFTLRVYRHGMRRNGAARERLRALVAGTDWAPSGTGAQNGVLADLLTATPLASKTAR
jgi:integrase